MEKSLKTREIIDAYQLLGEAKYHKLEDTDKIKVWKLSRKLKPIATQALEDKQDASAKLLPDYFQDKWKEAIEYEKVQNEQTGTTKMTEAEYNEFVIEFKKYNSLVGKAIEELLNKEVCIEFEPLSEDAMGQLIACNNWPLSQVESLEWMIK